MELIGPELKELGDDLLLLDLGRGFQPALDYYIKEWREKQPWANELSR